MDELDAAMVLILRQAYVAGLNGELAFNSWLRAFLADGIPPRLLEPWDRPMPPDISVEVFEEG